MATIHNKKTKRAMERLKMSTNRVPIFVWIGSSKTPIQSFSFVSDVKKKEVCFFTTNKIALNTKVFVAFHHQENPAYKANVFWIKQFSSQQKFLGSKMCGWRCGSQFEFASEDEKKRYEKFLFELRSRIVSTVAGAQPLKPPEEEKKDDIIAEKEEGGEKKEGKEGEKKAEGKEGEEAAESEKKEGEEKKEEGGEEVKSEENAPEAEEKKSA